MILLELKLKFNNTVKWYMYKPESVYENEKHTFLWEFEIQMDDPTLVRKPNLVLINKEKKELFM